MNDNERMASFGDGRSVCTSVVAGTAGIVFDAGVSGEEAPVCKTEDILHWE
jgi:hypothetical protein